MTKPCFNLFKTQNEFTQNISCPHGQTPCSHDLPSEHNQGLQST
jgi:hypothetical protein